MSKPKYPYIAWIGNPREKSPFGGSLFNQAQLADDVKGAVKIARTRLSMGSIKEYIIYKPVKFISRPNDMSIPIKEEDIE